MQKETLTTGEAATILKCNRQYIIYLLQMGKLKGELTKEKKPVYLVDKESFDKFKAKRDAIRKLRETE